MSVRHHKGREACAKDRKHDRLPYAEHRIFRTVITPDLVERKSDETKLGGNAIAIVTLSTYAAVFDSDRYDKLIAALANSVLDTQEEDGSYYHVLSFPDFQRKERDRIVYYDGEATFALARAYSITKRQPLS